MKLPSLFLAVALFAVVSLRAQSPPSIDHHQHLFSPTAVALAPGVATVSADDLVQLLDKAGMSDGAAGENLRPREAWAAFRQLPLSETEFTTIASNVAPYMR